MDTIRIATFNLQNLDETPAGVARLKVPLATYGGVEISAPHALFAIRNHNSLGIYLWNFNDSPLTTVQKPQA